MFIQLFLIAALFFIFYQDLRYRAVYWFVFPALLIVMLILAFQQQPLEQLFLNSSCNLGFLLVQFLLLSAYFSVKAGRMVNITSGYLGWGDILFLICIAFYLSPANYLFFYILSLLLVLLSTLILLGFKRDKRFKIPLAGLQAILFAFILVTDWRFDAFTLTSDYWLLKHLNL